MALSVTQPPTVKRVPGTRTHVVTTVSFDNSYPTGGYPFDANAQLGLSTIEEGPQIQAKGGVLPEYDATNKKILIRWGNAGSASLMPEVTNGTDLSAITSVQVSAEGKKGP